MTTSQLLALAKSKVRIATVFRFPYVNLIVIDERFRDQSDDEKEAQFATWISVPIPELRSTLQNSLFTLRLLTAQEYEVAYGKEPQERGHHWLGALAARESNGSSQRFDSELALSELGLKVVHFYGYKGGQGRSTVLALLATALAEDGWRVLTVDSDLEAPSLDIIFGRNVRPLTGTLLGVAQGVSDFTPERVRVPSRGRGYVDLLACRPRRPEYDIDAAAFALRSALDSTLIETAARRIRQKGHELGYDVVLVDHRAGLSPVTLPWMTTLRGPTVIFARLDDQWRPATTFLKTVVSENSENPGVFVSWKPDEEDSASYRFRNASQIDALLDILAEALSGTDELREELSSAELEDHWVLLPYDSSFRQARLPENKALAPATSEAILTIRRLIELGGQRSTSSAPAMLTPSGATDTGDLIQTAVLRELLVPGNSISYVLGRKGTGKTRLLRELANAAIGEPLVVDSSGTENRGIPSPSAELSQAAVKCESDPERLWWSLIFAALELPDTRRDRLRDAFLKTIDHIDPVSAIQGLHPSDAIRTLLIDSLETAFPAALMQRYLESLFRVLQVIDTDSRLSSRVKFKLFLRSDLAERGFQNIEQQLYGRTKYLSWNTQLIFNFVLSRISAIGWYQSAFPDLVNKIEHRKADVLKGEMPVEACEQLLLMAFPQKLRRNNLQTTTFLKTYFADSASDRTESSGADRLRYYPRIFDKFLDVIAQPQLSLFTGGQRDQDGKISQNLIFIAHEEAAKSYLNQLESELVYLIRLDDDHSRNQTNVRALLNAFAGLKTPFVLEEQIEALAPKVPSVDRAAIRVAMESMKRVGMFEDRPDYEGQWRVGRLFKSSLRMKYVR